MDSNIDKWGVSATKFKMSPDTRCIFVSSSSGSDDNDGLTPAGAVRSIERGKYLLRPGFPDWLLLKNSDIFYDGIGNFNLSGRSAAEPMIIGFYGPKNKRPIVYGSVGFPVNKSISDVVIYGIEFISDQKNSSKIISEIGLDLKGSGVTIIIENCVLDGYSTGIYIGSEFKNVSIRNCDIRNCKTIHSKGYSCGIYAACNDILVEGCIIDNNGWNINYPNNNMANMGQNHGININNVKSIIRDNFIISNHNAGINGIGDFTVNGNVFINNFKAIEIGGYDHNISNNICLWPRKYGFIINSCRKTFCDNNLCLGSKSDLPLFKFGYAMTELSGMIKSIDNISVACNNNEIDTCNIKYGYGSKFSKPVVCQNIPQIVTMESQELYKIILSRKFSPDQLRTELYEELKGV